ncbi:DUF4199 domain-containing protein [Bacteroides sp. 224]|uniref:DUF4199 domain-containing protein n=1 Tax=Bacteroides sp. 224 TaxID=2302936 RepID=UPI0013D61C40|nr:DUF4199 domain-containing protein [Bacteroides sp. 224]NDV65908.1 DUF4199 domain-containing protein [Bacteroides sp. 224]
MNENKVSIQKYAMHFGTYMGIFWILKFALFPIGMTNPFLMFLFIGFTFTVPFLAYYFAKSFRDKICGGSITFVQAWVFLIFVFLFASLLTAMAHYIYFRYLDHGHIINTYAQMLNTIPENATAIQAYTNQINEAINQIRAMTPIEISMQLLSSNVLNCSILSLIISLFVAKKKNTIQ